MRLVQALHVERGELLIGLTLEMFGQTLMPAKKESPPALSRLRASVRKVLQLGDLVEAELDRSLALEQ